MADRLKPIPRDVEDAIAHGSAEECGAAKKAKQKLQIANQKIVARAEEARRRQTTLDTYEKVKVFGYIRESRCVD